MRKFAWILIIFFSFITILIISKNSHAYVYNIGNISVYANHKDATLIFKSIEKTFKWYIKKVTEGKSEKEANTLRYNIYKSYINIVTTKIDNGFGYFDKRFVFVRSYSDPINIYGINTKDPNIYMACVAHEIIHALQYQKHFNFYCYHGSGEYAAYVCMLDLFPFNKRKEALNNNKKYSAFETEFELSLYTYELLGMAYGIKAYKHYLKDNGKLLKKILECKFKSYDHYMFAPDSKGG